MKILMLTDRLDVGGAETHIAQLAVGLRENGVEVEILSSGGKTALALADMGFVCHHLNFCTHDPIRLLCLRRKLHLLIRKNGYDIVHAHARIPALLLRGRKIGAYTRIVTVHARFRSNSLLSALCYWGEKTVAVSEDLRSYVCDTYHIPGEAVRVIPNGIDCERFAPRSHDTSNQIRILFASRLDPDCSLGAKLLCRISPALFRRFPNLQIGIVGGGEEYPHILSLASSVNRILGREQITLYGEVDDMPALLRKQDIFIGVSRAAMEAAACGCAVILCGNEGYLGMLSKQNQEEAILSNLCCRDCHAPTAPRLECDLRRLIEDPDLRDRLGKEARELILSHFNARRMVDDTLSLYLRACHPPYRRRLLIGGYFGCGNAGDDAILLGFLEGMHQIAPDTEIWALTDKPCLAQKRFGIPCIGRKNPIAVRSALRASNMFICGGGSLLQNATSRRSLFYYLSLLCMAKRYGCKTVLYSAGIGPLYGDNAKKELTRVLNTCDYISLRDPLSLRELSVLGVDPSLLHEGADPALLISLPPKTRSVALLREHRIAPDAHLFGIVLRRTPPSASHLWKSILTASQIYCQRQKLQPILLVFGEEDRGLTESVSHVMEIRTISVREVGDLAAILRICNGIFSMRLHALILAAATATPAIGIVTDLSDKKITAFASIAGQEALADPRPAVGELVDLAQHQFFGTDAQSSNLIASAAEELRKKAWKDLANIVEMLYNKRDAENTLSDLG